MNLSEMAGLNIKLTEDKIALIKSTTQAKHFSPFQASSLQFSSYIFFDYTKNYICIPHNTTVTFV